MHICIIQFDLEKKSSKTNCTRSYLDKRDSHFHTENPVIKVSHCLISNTVISSTISATNNKSDKTFLFCDLTSKVLWNLCIDTCILRSLLYPGYTESINPSRIYLSLKEWYVVFWWLYFWTYLKLICN